MSLTSSLASALSGLTAASRSIDVVSANVSNAMTDGYAKREIQLASETVGGNGAGVKVVGITRLVNERALADQREANANSANAETQADAWLRIETAIGFPTEDGSLTDRIDAFESALISASSRPEETVRLQDAISAAVSLAESINGIADEISDVRMDADADIATMVEDTNTMLQQVETLNWQVFKMGNSGQDTAALMDERQSIIDSLSEIIPIRQVNRDGNQVALFTSGGATLIDGPAAELSFTPHIIITPNMTIENGQLSGLELNGEPLSINSTYGSIEGGRLAAAFEVRDSIATEAQSSIDAIARNLIERFEDSTLDPSIATSGTGLFTDNDLAFVSTEEVGIANSLKVNSLVDPAEGGEVWRLRDGIGAAVSGAVGDSSLISALADRIAEATSPTSGPSTGLSRSFTGLASDFLSSIDSSFRNQEASQAFHTARADALAYELAEDSVDTDDEMQKLLMIETVYAANARVIDTIDQLMQQILEL
ncbi:flagellar hook-associated protein FlgK [Tropicimonas sp. TH_r6]|uniref:flagellar hook-associated protein FlgK n=1 Tax=Tropicimonas sp. TH_r6 TaxID=3082085 RepID=UPI0029543791|nr:flagellar hook-associated protein FlgK [Tropicimonas sp. TH_r6]MDV7144151.1 flagellar hook-associated protein FlgK [Tropicimonas sp. TH_r6]